MVASIIELRPRLELQPGVERTTTAAEGTTASTRAGRRRATSRPRRRSWASGRSR